MEKPMSHLYDVIGQYEKQCLTCGRCVKNCPMVPYTDLKGVDPAKIMEEVRDLFRHRKIGQLARTRVYSCLFCNACRVVCPTKLYPGLVFGAGKGVLRELGDPLPKGVDSILKAAAEMMEQAVPSFQGYSGQPDWLITDMSSRPVETARTVLFSSCFGLVEKNVLDTTVKILRRIDPDIKVLGGYDFCCGELHYIAGRPQEAQVQFSRLIQALEAFSPEKVVIFCPTCNMNFDERHRDSGWSHIFIMDYIADQLSRLGPLDRVDAAVTIHDPCHFVRGSRPGSDAPRKILRSIPGIRIAEMENARENSLCCGAYAITGTGASGMRFRDARLRQAENTGAGILSVYCPGCQMILGGPGPKLSLRVESILTLLGRSLGLV